MFVNNKVITVDNLFEIVDYHLFPKGIAIYYCDPRNKNNYNVIGFTEYKLSKMSTRKILQLLEKGIFLNTP